MIKRIALLVATALLTTSCAALGWGSECSGTSLIANFEQVGDLVENSNVQSGDVVIGSVSSIELDGWTARVQLCVNEEEKISRDVRAVVRSTSLLGEKFVDLQPASQDPPYLQDGDIIDVDATGKASELEDVFSRLATILGSGNLEALNQFTASQATILRNKAGDVRQLLSRLTRFTGTLAGKRGELASALDTLDDVSRTILSDSGTLKDFLRSFAASSTVLAQQKEGLEDLLVSLDRFTEITVALLDATEEGLNKQFDKLRPVLRTVVRNSADLAEGLRSLATFTEWFPESMPGDYLQLDVCQALPEDFGTGETCPQSVERDDPDVTLPGGPAPITQGPAENSVELILRRPIEKDES